MLKGKTYEQGMLFIVWKPQEVETAATGQIFTTTDYSMSGSEGKKQNINQEF